MSVCSCGSVKGNASARCQRCATAHQKSAAMRPCLSCGKMFIKGRSSRNSGKCCSRLCGWAYQKAVKAAERAARPPVPIRACMVCHAPVGPARRYCAPCAVTRAEAAYRASRAAYTAMRQSRPERVCAQCQEPFVPVQGSRKFCSNKCSKKFQRAIGKRLRKARQRGVERERVSPTTVFTRDGWRCQLCGVSTPRRLQGQMVDNAPELDHIVPLAVGGPHTYANTQCLCRACNGRKGARALGQLRLVG